MKKPTKELLKLGILQTMPVVGNADYNINNAVSAGISLEISLPKGPQHQLYILIVIDRTIDNNSKFI